MRPRTPGSVRCRLVVALVIAAALGLDGCRTSGAQRQPDTTGAPRAGAPGPASRFSDYRWKAVLFAPIGSIPAFDNAVKDLATKLRARGVDVVAVLSAREGRAGARGTAAELRQAIVQMKPGADEGCLVFMTSHGTVEGLRTPRDAGHKILEPKTLAEMIDAGCATAPAILVVSACHSGTFLRDPLVGPNRIVVTAAAEQRASFGCRADVRYTFYDQCLLTELDRASTWEDLHRRVRSCVATREKNRREPPSDPQASFGSEMKDLRLPRR
jgi:hypothetical protein